MTYELIEFEGKGYLYLSGFDKIRLKEAKITHEEILNNLDAQGIIDNLWK